MTSGSMTISKMRLLSPVMILRRILNHYKTICSGRNLELFLEIPEQSENFYLLRSDKEIFQKVMTHLLDNAAKFTEKGGHSF